VLLPSPGDLAAALGSPCLSAEDSSLADPAELHKRRSTSSLVGFDSERGDAASSAAGQAGGGGGPGSTAALSRLSTGGEAGTNWTPGPAMHYSRANSLGGETASSMAGRGGQAREGQGEVAAGEGERIGGLAGVRRLVCGPPMWGPMRQALLEGALQAARQTNNAGDMWEVAAALLRWVAFRSGSQNLCPGYCCVWWDSVRLRCGGHGLCC
jgi:hypothetical protein